MGGDMARDLYYLAAGGAGSASGVVVLEGPDGRVAPVFSSREGAGALAAEAPQGVRVGCAPAGDPRAREELLLACLENGAEVLAVDPGPGRGPPECVTPVRLVLAAVRSQRTGTACL